jgi:redox-sensitive bicupin YhaK (pirin superfamily)
MIEGVYRMPVFMRKTHANYVSTGSSQHEDSVGHKGRLGPGDVQWMIAGKGIVHAEVRFQR